TVISTGSEVGPTASPIVIRRKGKEVMVMSDTPKKKKLQEEIDAQVARELEEQQEKENMRINEQIARDAKVSQQRRTMTKKQKREYYMAVIKTNLGGGSKISKEETERLKRKEKANDQEAEEGILYGYDQKQLGWRLKDFKGMSFEEIEAEFAKVWKQVENFIPMGLKEETERLKRKGLNLEKEQLVPVEDVYVQALQVKHLIIDWKVHT
nr:hypothetical protein [Tanacetum cinerariifolium]